MVAGFNFTELEAGEKIVFGPVTSTKTGSLSGSGAPGQGQGSSSRTSGRTVGVTTQRVIIEGPQGARQHTDHPQCGCSAGLHQAQYTSGERIHRPHQGRDGIWPNGEARSQRCARSGRECASGDIPQCRSSRGQGRWEEETTHRRGYCDCGNLDPDVRVAVPDRCSGQAVWRLGGASNDTITCLSTVEVGGGAAWWAWLSARVRLSGNGWCSATFPAGCGLFGLGCDVVITGLDKLAEGPLEFVCIR